MKEVGRNRASRPARPLYHRPAATVFLLSLGRLWSLLSTRAEETERGGASVCLLCCPPGDGALFSFDIRHFCCVRACACGVCVCIHYILYDDLVALFFFFRGRGGGGKTTTGRVGGDVH